MEPGKFSYALPNKAEVRKTVFLHPTLSLNVFDFSVTTVVILLLLSQNTLNVVYLQESNVCIIATKNYGFDVKVPQRIYQ